MFKRSRNSRPSGVSFAALFQTSLLENLEDRRLMSASHHVGPAGHGDIARGPVNEIAFSLAPAAVQTGLEGLAQADGYSAPGQTDEVYLGNRDGVETYSLRESSTGTKATLTVDASGTAVTAPTRTTTTFGAISDSAVVAEFNALATAISATAPASTDSVTVSTPASGVATYTLKLTTTGNNGRTHSTAYTVDADGNVVGNARVPLSVLSSAVQNGLTSNAPTGATALTGTSEVNVSTIDGVTLYSVTYKTTGTRTTISVDTTGALHSGTSSDSITYADVPSAAATELQTLATAEGVTTAIASTTKVTQTTEANGTVLYTIRLTATSTSDSSVTYPITLTVDAAGNPTVGPGGMGGGGPLGGPAGGCGGGTSTAISNARRR